MFRGLLLTKLENIFFFRKGQVLGKATKVEIRETERNINTVDASVFPEAVSDADKLKLFDLSHVPVEQKENLISVLKANIDVFVTKDSELTQTHVTEMVINTQGHLPHQAKTIQSTVNSETRVRKTHRSNVGSRHHSQKQLTLVIACHCRPEERRLSKNLH